MFSYFHSSLSLNNSLNTILSVAPAAVICKNSSINYEINNAFVFGNLVCIHLYGRTVKQLNANNSYFIPNLRIVGYENKKISGVGLTRTVSSDSDGTDSYPCTVIVENNQACITPTVTLKTGFGISIVAICIML